MNRLGMVSLLAWCCTMNLPVTAQEANYDESRIPPYTLPDPLRTEAGQVVTTVEDWVGKRRGETLALFQQHVFGTMPAADAPLEVVRRRIDKVQVSLPLKTGEDAGAQVLAEVEQWELDLQRPGRQQPPITLRLITFRPADSSQPVPVILGYNFFGNHSLTDLPHVPLAQLWDRKTGREESAAEASRGQRASLWPVAQILNRGYALVTLYYGDVDPDFDDGFANGVHALYPELQNRPDNWSAIGAWAWGLQVIRGQLQTDPLLDASRVIVFGHSRLGKTALWAGATDPGFAAVISNNSGCGGAALSRRRIGESVARINTTFPHWFCLRHRDYNDNEDACPVDHHQLIALSAPRPVYVASATEDTWADPKGEFLSAFHAGPVYRLWDAELAAAGKITGGLGLSEPQMPAPQQPLGRRIGYHLRQGKHDVTLFDWMAYLDFLDRHLKRDHE